MGYTAPIRDMKFILEDIVNIKQIQVLKLFEEVSPDLIEAVLTESGRLASEVIAPTNRAGDEYGSRLTDKGVQTAPGFANAYRKFVGGGWGSIPCEPEHGGGSSSRRVRACGGWGEVQQLRRQPAAGGKPWPRDASGDSS